MGFRLVRFSGFRNLKETEVDLDAHDVYLIGENGQGKTNFLEALYYLSYGSSFRTRSDRDIVAWDSNCMRLYGDTDSEKERSGNLQINWENGVKTIKMHGKTITDRQELLSRVPAIAFVHDDFLFVTGPAEKRRLFIDQTSVMDDPTYVQILRRYKKCLREFNHLLKTENTALLGHYTEQLVTVGLELCLKRKKTTQKLEAILKPLFTDISGIPDSLSLIYEPAWKQTEEISEVMQKMEMHRSRDLAMGNAGLGPHRDKFIFQIYGREFTKVASTGQQRLLSLSLRVAQARFFYENTARKPILLLDDVLLELDPERRKLFRDKLPESEQIIYTFLTEEAAGSVSDNSIAYEVRKGEFHKYA